MKEVKTHHVPGVPTTVRVFPEGDPDKSGACTSYRLTLGVPGQESGKDVMLKFQDRPVKDGVTGLTTESLLAVVIDRLKDVQAGKQTNRGRAVALTHLETALLWLNAIAKEAAEQETVQ